MTAPAEIVRLVETFERNKEAYRQGGLNEAQLRQEFLNPFFKALGWDVDNTQGWAEPYKEVIHEDAIRIESSLKAPDYCFRIGGTRKSFVKAKAPWVNVEDAGEPDYQVRRYAWLAEGTGGTSWSERHLLRVGQIGKKTDLHLSLQYVAL